MGSLSTKCVQPVRWVGKTFGITRTFTQLVSVLCWVVCKNPSLSTVDTQIIPRCFMQFSICGNSSLYPVSTAPIITTICVYKKRTHKEHL